MTTLRSQLLGVVLLLALVACGGEATPDREPSRNGPLETNMGSGGGVGLTPPEVEGRWHGMFGAMRLCVSSPGVVTITKIDPLTASDGEPVRAVVRRVSESAARAGETPFISLKGTPETEFESKAGQQIESAVGAKVSRSCSEDRREAGFDELVVVLSSASPAKGNFVTETRISYQVGGRGYVTTVPWVFGLCDQEDNCPGLDSTLR